MQVGEGVLPKLVHGKKSKKNIRGLCTVTQGSQPGALNSTTAKMPKMKNGSDLLILDEQSNILSVHHSLFFHP